MQLTIQIVGWNSQDVLPDTLTALRVLETDTSIIIRYIDNNSRDDSVALVKRLLPQCEIIALSHNHGFAGGHNIGLAQCATPFILILNPDVILNVKSLPDLLAAFDDPTIAAIQGILYRSLKPAIIDSAGIDLTLALNGIDRGAGQSASATLSAHTHVIATTGACSLYRMQSLQAIAHSKNEFFDQDFFAYKEDVDLGWRLARANLKSICLPIMAGTHVRQLRRSNSVAWGGFATSLNRLRAPGTRYSLRNWVWMIVKNASLTQAIIHSPLIAIRASIFVVLSILYPPLLSVWIEIIRGLPRMWHKRRQAIAPAAFVP